MSDLTHDAPIGTTQLRIDTRLSVERPGFAVKVDDELLFVGGVEFRDGLTLALKYPTTAAHSAGTEVVPVLDAYTTDDSSPFASGGGGSGLVLSRTTTLTDAQMKALPASPVELVPAPGADNLLVFFSAVWKADTAGGKYAGYDGTAGPFSYIQYADGGRVSDSVYSNLIFDDDDLVMGILNPGHDLDLDTIDPAVFFTRLVLPTADGDPAGFVNKALQFRTISDGLDSPLTGGNAANSLRVTVLYAVVAM